MGLDTDFSFDHEHVGAVANATRLLAKAPSLLSPLPGIPPRPDFLNLLRGLVGDATNSRSQVNPNLTWLGTGFNLIWRPNNDKKLNNADFFLEMNQTNETLSFTDVSGPTGVANRAFAAGQVDIFLGCIGYLQTINDRIDGKGLHFETGTWINVPATINPQEAATVTRMGSIPHGTTVNLQGRAFTAPRPQFQPSSIVPFIIGSPDDGHTGLVKTGDIGKALNLDPSSSGVLYTPLSHVPGLTPAEFANPNSILEEVTKKQTFAGTTVLQIDSFTSAKPPTVPDVGGGVENIAFLVGKGAPPAGPNGAVPDVSAVFWIEQVRDQSGKTTLQLQYTQRVLLNFNGLSWPHVTVATLTPKPSP